MEPWGARIFVVVQLSILLGTPLEGAPAGKVRYLKFKNKHLRYLTRELGRRVRQMTVSLQNIKSKKVHRAVSPAMVHLWGDGERGYVPEIGFPVRYRKDLSVDLDRDGDKEIIFTVSETAGGTAAWSAIFALDWGRRPALRRLKVPCPCPVGLSCRDSPRPDIVGWRRGALTIDQQCLRKEDAECCPSEEYRGTYRYRRGKLRLTFRKRSLSAAGDEGR